MTTRQVKSKARVAEHGEVFTAAREVNAMLDLVKQETERIDSRFLEKTLPTLIQANETKKSAQIDAFLEIDANAQRQEYKMAS